MQTLYPSGADLLNTEVLVLIYGQRKLPQSVSNSFEKFMHLSPWFFCFLSVLLLLKLTLP